VAVRIGRKRGQAEFRRQADEARWRLALVETAVDESRNVTARTFARRPVGCGDRVSRRETNVTMMEECLLVVGWDQPLDWWPQVFTFGVWNSGSNAAA
jgi:hypothetical protein